jgi:hypothetical protein
MAKTVAFDYHTARWEAFRVAYQDLSIQQQVSLFDCVHALSIKLVITFDEAWELLGEVGMCLASSGRGVRDEFRRE